MSAIVVKLQGILRFAQDDKSLRFAPFRMTIWTIVGLLKQSPQKRG